MWEKQASGSYIDENGNHIEWEQTDGGLSWYDYILQLPAAIRWGGWMFVIGLFVAPFILLRDALCNKRGEPPT